MIDDEVRSDLERRYLQLCANYVLQGDLGPFMSEAQVERLADAMTCSATLLGRVIARFAAAGLGGAGGIGTVHETVMGVVRESYLTEPPSSSFVRVAEWAEGQDLFDELFRLIWKRSLEAEKSGQEAMVSILTVIGSATTTLLTMSCGQDRVVGFQLFEGLDAYVLKEAVDTEAMVKSIKDLASLRRATER